jgi:Rieske Fe-S protein
VTAVDTNDPMDRRRFLALLPVLAGTSTLAATGCAGVRFVAAAHDAGPGGPRLIVRRPDLGKLLPGTGVLVQHPLADLPIYLHRDEDAPAATSAPTNGDAAAHASGTSGASRERYTAVWTLCMHRGYQVEPEGDRLVCPCHGSEYAFDGAVLQGPTESPLARYRVSADAERIYIHLAPGGTP